MVMCRFVVFFLRFRVWIISKELFSYFPQSTGGSCSHSLTHILDSVTLSAYSLESRWYFIPWKSSCHMGNETCWRMQENHENSEGYLNNTATAESQWCQVSAKHMCFPQEILVKLLPSMCFPHGFKQKNITNTQRLQQLSHPVRTYDI